MTRENLISELIADGWKSPNTYRDHYSQAPDAPGVYLFAAYNIITAAVRVAYIGQSRRLARRWSNHPIVPLITRDMHEDETIWRWFVRCDAALLREREAKLIQKYNPPYNIIGRPRGFA